MTEKEKELETKKEELTKLEKFQADEIKRLTELQKNSVSKEDYEKLEAEFSKSIDAHINSAASIAKSLEPKEVIASPEETAKALMDAIDSKKNDRDLLILADKFRESMKHHRNMDPATDLRDFNGDGSLYKAQTNEFEGQFDSLREILNSTQSDSEFRSEYQRLATDDSKGVRTKGMFEATRNKTAQINRKPVHLRNK